MGATGENDFEMPLINTHECPGCGEHVQICIAYTGGQTVALLRCQGCKTTYQGDFNPIRRGDLISFRGHIIVAPKDYPRIMGGVTFGLPSQGS